MVALLCGVVALVVVVSSSLSGGSGESVRLHRHRIEHREVVRRKAPATYVVKSGDTLTAISHATGVGVRKIERLNPQVDPQILIAGEKLKLR